MLLGEFSCFRCGENEIFAFLAFYVVYAGTSVSRQGQPICPIFNGQESQKNSGNRFPVGSPSSYILCFTSPAPVLFLTSSLPAPLVNSSFFRSDPVVSTLLSHVLVATAHTAPEPTVPWQFSLLSSIQFIARAQAALLPPMFFISTLVSEFVPFLQIISFFRCYSGVSTSYFLFSLWSNMIGSLTFFENQLPPTPSPT